MLFAFARERERRHPGPHEEPRQGRGLEYRTATFPQVVSPAGATVDCKPDTFASAAAGSSMAPTASRRSSETTPDDVDGMTFLADGWRMEATSTAGRDARTYAICATKA